MQTVSSDFTTAANAAANQPSFRVSVSWLKTYNSLLKLFTIGVSSIEGPDVIPGPNSSITYFDQYDYIDESNNIDGFSIDRTVSRIPIGTMSAQLDVNFDNTSKRYLPTYDPTIGNYIKPGRPIKVNVGFGSEQVQQFVGFGGRPKITYGNRKLSLHAYDAMEFVNNFESQLGVQTNITISDMMKLLLNEMGFTTTQYDVELSLQSPVGIIAPHGKKAGQLMREMAESELGVIFFDEKGIFHFWNRYHFNKNPSSVATLSYSNISDLTIIDTPVINHVRVLSKPRTVREKQPVWVLSGTIFLPKSSTTTKLGSFTDDDGDMPVTNLASPSSVNDPISDSYIITNTEEDGSGSSGQPAVTISSISNFGDAFAINIQNSSTDDLYVTSLVLYGQPAKVSTTINEEYKDQTSIDDNGLNPDDNGQVIEVTNNFVQSAGDAMAYASILVTRYKQPRKQFFAPIFVNPAYQFGDVVTLNIADTGESIKSVIYGNTISMTKDTVLAQSVTLEGADFTSYFTIGVSSIGGTDKIAP